MGGAQQAQGVKVVAFDDEVAVGGLRLNRLTASRWRMASVLHQPGQHQVGVECGVTLDGAGFPIQAQFLFGEVFNQQPAQLLFVQVVELREEAVGFHALILHAG